MPDLAALAREVELLEKRNALLERNRKLECKSSEHIQLFSDAAPRLTQILLIAAARKQAEAAGKTPEVGASLDDLVKKNALLERNRKLECM